MKGLKIALVAGLVLGAGFVGGEVDAATKSKAVKKVKVESVVKKSIAKSANVKYVDAYALDKLGIPVMTKEEYLGGLFTDKVTKIDSFGKEFTGFEYYNYYKSYRTSKFYGDYKKAFQLDGNVKGTESKEVIDRFKKDMYTAAYNLKELYVVETAPGFCNDAGYGICNIYGEKSVY